VASPVILIVTPYAAAANNGNTRTAARWAALLQNRYRVIVRTPADELDAADLLIALHARRSHAALRAWRERRPRRPLAVVLTGTDLYRDVPAGDADALDSLRSADRLIVLQQRGVAALPAAFRGKARVIHQSSPPQPAFAKAASPLEALFVGHLRAEKDPCTFLRAAARLRDRPGIRFALVGGMRDPALEAPLRALLAAAPNAAMLGALPHADTRERIRRAHLLVVPSRMEGGANVVVEAIVSGTAVIASDCDGNLGMLGDGYPGCFPAGDDAALAHSLLRCLEEPAWLHRLEAMCRARAPLFTAAAERQALEALIAELTAPA
jgi:putative glycosyltransferase (TIGR04348 family)